MTGITLGWHNLSWQNHRLANRLADRLVAVARSYRDAFTTLGATARQHRLSALGLHADPETVRLRPATPVGLECALRHGKSSVFLNIDWKNNWPANGEPPTARNSAEIQTLSIAEQGPEGQTELAEVWLSALE